MERFLHQNSNCSVSKFLKSLKGTNPPGAKEKQGELYVEEVVAINSQLPILTKTK
jgi:hypothetical protein